MCSLLKPLSTFASAPSAFKTTIESQKNSRRNTKTMPSSRAKICLMVICTLVLVVSASAQTFQYSKGWEPGRKRADDQTFQYSKGWEPGRKREDQTFQYSNGWEPGRKRAEDQTFQYSKGWEPGRKRSSLKNQLYDPELRELISRMADE